MYCFILSIIIDVLNCDKILRPIKGFQKNLLLTYVKTIKSYESFFYQHSSLEDVGGHMIDCFLNIEMKVIPTFDAYNFNVLNRNLYTSKIIR